METIIGKKFGRLLVLEKSDKKINRDYLYKCQCDCGNFTYQTKFSLINGHARSCGCLKKEKASQIVQHQIVDGTKPAIFTDKPNKNNSSGFRGVAPYQQSGRTKYKASLYFKGVNHSKKGFETAEEAREYRLELEKKYLKF